LPVSGNRVSVRQVMNRAIRIGTVPSGSARPGRTAGPYGIRRRVFDVCRG
jgi:hypothetical protein